jgi:hypothetical protein
MHTMPGLLTSLLPSLSLSLSPYLSLSISRSLDLSLSGNPSILGGGARSLGTATKYQIVLMVLKSANLRNPPLLEEACPFLNVGSGVLPLCLVEPPSEGRPLLNVGSEEACRFGTTRLYWLD